MFYAGAAPDQFAEFDCVACRGRGDELVVHLDSDGVAGICVAVFAPWFAPNFALKSRIVSDR